MNYEGKWNGKIIRSPRLKKKTPDKDAVPKTENVEPEISRQNEKLNAETNSILNTDENHSTILESLSLIFEFKVNRIPGEDFGFQLALKENNECIIESIIPNSPIDRMGAGQCLKLRPGDQLISINSYPIPVSNIQYFINELPLLIRLRIQRTHYPNDIFLKMNNIKPHRIIIAKEYFKKLTTKFEICETPIKNYIKVGRFIFESFSLSKLVSNDVIVKINNVDLYGFSIKDIINLINGLDDYIVLYILRENANDNVTNNSVQNSRKHVSKPILDKIQSNLIIPSIQIDDESIENNISSEENLENSNKSTKIWYPQHGLVFTKKKTRIGSIKRIKTRIRPRLSRRRTSMQKKTQIPIKSSESKGTMTDQEHTNEDNSKILRSNLTNCHFENSDQVSIYTKTQSFGNLDFQEIRPKDLFFQIDSKNYDHSSNRPFGLVETLIDGILKNHCVTNICWDKFENRKLFWNMVITAFIGKFGLGISCVIYKGFPIVNSFHKIGAASINTKIRLGDLIISLNEIVLVNKPVNDVNSILKSVPQGLVTLRIIRNICLKESIGENNKMTAEKITNVPRSLLERNIIDLTQGVILKIEIEKTNVIGFFIDGGNGQPISIKKMYSGSSGSKMGILLRPGDIIISVDEKDFRNLSHGDGFQILQELKPGKHQMEIFRKF